MSICGLVMLLFSLVHQNRLTKSPDGVIVPFHCVLTYYIYRSNQRHCLIISSSLFRTVASISKQIVLNNNFFFGGPLQYENNSNATFNYCYWG